MTCTCDPEAYDLGPEGQRRYFEDRYCPIHGERILGGERTTFVPGGEGRHVVHVYSLFGRWCYRCGHRKRWWAFWEIWTEEEHDEPF